MLAAFLTQFAAGCCLAVAASSMKESGWKYLRLMAAVSLGLMLFALAGLILHRRTTDNWTGGGGLMLGILLTIGWLFVNAVQGEAVRPAQRWWPLAAGLACLWEAMIQATMANGPGLNASRSSPALPISAVLGSALLGTVTASMLLGHRYLTDTDLSIAPLRRMTKLYLAAVAARTTWAIAAGIIIWSRGAPVPNDYIWFWLMLTIRMGVGIIGVGAFAWMAWDCVRRRATQSATAMFYLSMVLVFFGELAAQYLARTEGLPM